MLPIHQLLKKYNKAGRVAGICTLFMITSIRVFAADAPEPSIFTNPLAVTLLLLMGVLLIVIAVLASILIGAADWKVRLGKKPKPPIIKMTVLIAGMLSIASSVTAQDIASTETVANAVNNFGGLSPTAFYLIASVIFLELAIILILLINIRFLIRAAKEKEVVGTENVEMKVVEIKKPVYHWWNRINRFKPVEQEMDIDLGHDYDGIRELDNRLPPWWLWGFYITIIFAVVYLWRYHVSETAPLSEEEYVQSVQLAELRVQEHLKKKGESVNENTVTFLADASDLANGAKIYTASCVVCHNSKGEGSVGPNLTDDYWLHGGDIKSIFKTIKYGVDGKGMAAWSSVYSSKEIAQVSSYIKSLVGTNPPNAKEPQGILFKEAAVTDSLQTDATPVANN